MSATPKPPPPSRLVQGEENAGELPPSPPSAFPRCQAVVVGCIDFRFVEPQLNFLGSRGLAGDFDLISWPGGAVALGTADRVALLDAVALACDLHQPSELVLIVHHDCGRLGGSTSFAGRHAEIDTLDAALDIAREVAAARFPQLDIYAVRLDQVGSPTCIDALADRDHLKVLAHGPLRLHSPSQWIQWLLRHTIRLVVLVAGTAVVGAGVAMLVLPGPGILVVLFGLVILATQFVWAERALDRMTVTAASAANAASTHRAGRILLGLSATTMVVGGGLVVLLTGEYRLAGATALLSGLIGLGTLLPSVRRWVARRANQHTHPVGQAPTARHYERRLPPTSQQGRAHMNRSLLAELQHQHAYPSVSLLLTTKPGPSMAPSDLDALIGLADNADRRLEGDVPENTRRTVIESVRGLIASVAEQRATKAIAVFASPNYSAVVRLGDSTRDRVVIDNTFATRDLVADANRTALYRVVTLSDHKSRLFIGDRARLVEERTETWPLHRDDDQRLATWARAVTTAVAAEHARQPLPTVVAGVNRSARDVAKASNIDAIGIIRGNHDRTSWADLHNQAWPLVCDWLRTDNHRALDHLDTARGANRYAGGVHEVWELAHDARVELLVVEETYAYPARLRDAQLIYAVDIEAPDVIDDAIDELIELVLHNAGRVAIVADGNLADHDRLAAVLRY